MTSKHTPGPWTPYIEGVTICIDFGGKKGRRPNIVNWQGFDACSLPLAIQKANCILMAAAPELLQALEEFPSDADYPNAEEFRSACCIWRDIYLKRAIQRATGGAEG